jgi:hypothetical protein
MSPYRTPQVLDVFVYRVEVSCNDAGYDGDSIRELINSELGNMDSGVIARCELEGNLKRTNTLTNGVPVEELADALDLPVDLVRGKLDDETEPVWMGIASALVEYWGTDEDPHLTHPLSALVRELARRM